MALLTKKEFGALAGVDASYVSKYIKRGKLVSLNDLIDDQNETNIAFLEKRISKDRDRPEADLSYLEDEFLFNNISDYDPALEIDLNEINRDLPADNKLIPRLIINNLGNGAIIEICQVFLTREIALRQQAHFPIVGLQKEIETMCRKKIAKLKEEIDEVMQDITEGEPGSST